MLLSQNDSVLLRSTQLRPELYALLNYNVDYMRTLLIFLKQLYSKVNDQMLIMYVGFWQFRTVHQSGRYKRFLLD